MNTSWHWGKDKDNEKDDKSKKGTSFGSFFSSFGAGSSTKEDEEGTQKESTDESSATNSNSQDDEKKGQWNSFFSSLMADSGSKKDDDGKKENEAMESMLDSWIQNKGDDDEVSGRKSFGDLKRMLDLYKDELKRVGEKYFGDIEIQNLSPASLFYYLEKQDEIKNPSAKCRKHRFHKNLKVENVVELNTYFHYADLAYNEDKTEIKEALANPQHGGEPYEVIHTKLQSEPHNPAFIVAVKRDTVEKKDGCEILLAIRGTAGIEDVITDVLCESVEYRDGRAHNGILESGRNIAKQFKEFLDKFIDDLSVQGVVKVLMVGHSLGGGAACLAALELEDCDYLDIQVVGFGTPGCVSKNIGEKAHFITTVVSDSDVIPRTSGESVVNLVLDIMEYDWLDKARLDADLMLKDFQSKNSWIMSESTRETALDRINSLLETQIKPTIKVQSTKRIDPVLFPPGSCIHLWRDGVGISASVVPGTFFDEIDVSRTMLDDHLCENGYGAMFLGLMRQHHKDPHFRWESLYQKEEEESGQGN